MADNKKYVKVHCSVSDAYGLITMEQNNGKFEIVNFYEIDKSTAKNINTSHEGELPPVSYNLKACASCGSSRAGCCNKASSCKVKKGELWYQCLYCSNLKPTSITSAGSFDVYFLMDASGSMSKDDRKCAASAVRKLLSSLEGQGNTYTFVAWATSAYDVFANETNTSKMSSALRSYEDGIGSVGGYTEAGKALEQIETRATKSKKPVRIIFVTDGGFTDGSASYRVRDRILHSNSNVEILAIGVAGANQESLSRIGTVPQFTKVIGGIGGLTSTFEDIAKLLRDSGNNT